MIFVTWSIHTIVRACFITSISWRFQEYIPDRRLSLEFCVLLPACLDCVWLGDWRIHVWILKIISLFQVWDVFLEWINQVNRHQICTESVCCFAVDVPCTCILLFVLARPRHPDERGVGSPPNCCGCTSAGTSLISYSLHSSFSPCGGLYGFDQNSSHQQFSTM